MKHDPDANLEVVMDNIQNMYDEIPECLKGAAYEIAHDATAEAEAEEEAVEAFREELKNW